MDQKKLAKKLTKMVERLVDVHTLYRVRRATEVQLFKAASKAFSELVTLEQVEGVNVKVEREAIEALLKLDIQDTDGINDAVVKIADALYKKINLEKD